MDDALLARLAAIEKALKKLDKRLAKALKVAEPKPEPSAKPSHKGKRQYCTNTWLSALEVKKLTNALGTRDKFHAVVENFDRIKAEKEYIYANDYYPIVRWGIRAYEEYKKVTMGAALSESEATKAANEEEERWRSLG